MNPTPERAAEPQDPMEEIERLRRENAELRARLGISAVAEPGPAFGVGEPELPIVGEGLPAIDNQAPVEDKIKLFRTLFRGRDDVYATLWINERTGKKGYKPACEESLGSRKEPKKYFPFTDQVVHDHLAGKSTVGVFPLRTDNTCSFLACDFDKTGWLMDASAYLAVCKRYDIPAYLERSRSGNGGHVWIFFTSAVSAAYARHLGMRLLRETMDSRGDLDMGSYDRFFPIQDFVPKGGFGNLIALPLQKKCRALGNTEFLDTSSAELRPWPDQWAFLSRVRRISPSQLDALLEVVPPLAVGLNVGTRPTAAGMARQPAPETIRCVLSGVLSVEKSGIPPWMLSQLMRFLGLASKDIGQVGGGRDSQRGVVDLAMIQSLARREDLDTFFAGYGFIVVDECHHIPAVEFQGCVKKAPARYFLGLTATPYRRDGLQEIIFMQCGPVRHEMGQSSSGPPLSLIVRETAFGYLDEDNDRIQELLKRLAHDPMRDGRIIQDVLAAKGRMVQYVGRILREHPGKTSAVVYDYVDSQVGMLKAMYYRRLKAYKILGAVEEEA